MKILIDADGCPVVDETLRAARTYALETIILCDSSHRIEKSGAVTRVVDKGADSVDFALANLAGKGDIVVTQDYGLAAMCLARGARAIHQDGLEYTGSNIDALLSARHTAKEIRRTNGKAHLKGPKKRSAIQNRVYFERLSALLREASTGRDTPQATDLGDQ